MRGAARAAWAIALVVGCARSPASEPPQDPSFVAGNFGPEVTAGEGFASGSRLSAGVLQAEGGAARFDKTWRDTKLDVACAFALATDMTVRCLPGRSDLPLFADDACQHPIYARTVRVCGSPLPDASLPPPAFFRETVECSGAAIVRTVGQQIDLTSGAPLYERDSTGDCAPKTVDPLRYEAYAGGDAVDPKAFVAQTSVTREPRGASYAVERMTAEDGASAIVGIVDVARNMSCTPRSVGLAESEPLRCYPAMATAVSVNGTPQWSSDAACTVPVVEHSRCSTPSIVFEIETTAFRCGDAFTAATVAAVGADVGTVYVTGPSQAAGPSCSASPPDARLAYSVIGAPIDPATFPSLAVAEDGTARVRVHTLTAPSGDRLMANAFYDADHDTECLPHGAADGIVRCLPAVTGGLVAFADPGCAVPIVQVPAGCTTKPRFATSSVVETSGCTSSSSNESVFAVGAPAPASTAYLRTATGCAPYTAGNYVNYTAVELPASEFAAMRHTNGTAFDDTSLR